MSNPFISDTHDEPDHLDDRSPGIGVVQSALLGMLVVAAMVFGACVVAFALSNL